jgi:hypothetical protein
MFITTHAIRNSYLLRDLFMLCRTSVLIQTSSYQISYLLLLAHCRACTRIAPIHKMAAKRQIGDDGTDSSGWKRLDRCPECGCVKWLLTRPGLHGPRQWTSGPGAQCRASTSSPTGAHCANRTPEARALDPKLLYELPPTDGWQNKFGFLKVAPAKIKTTLLGTYSKLSCTIAQKTFQDGCD